METTIAGFARAGGVGVETVRYYQRRGLLAVPRKSGGIFLSLDRQAISRSCSSTIASGKPASGSIGSALPAATSRSRLSKKAAR